MRGVTILSVALVATTTTGCAFFKSLAGRNTVDLEGADVKAMSVDIRKEQKTICPRERVQLAVFLDAALEGETETLSLETWQGDENRNGKLSFEDFAFVADQGTVDGEGWYAPPPDLAATVAREMEIRTVYKARPDKFSMTMTYKPDYRCLVQAGRSGQAGRDGEVGSTGSSGSNGSSGSDSVAGGDGGDGSHGTAGTAGEAGAPAPSFAVYATMVRTEFYEQLVALKVEGEVNDFLLFPPEQSFQLIARGGPGGGGGPGGSGGDGGDGGSGNPGGNGGNGGHGGPGGPGADGGPGGVIRVVIDPRFPDIASKLAFDVSGGLGGPGGPGGMGGSQGSGGAAIGQGSSTGTSGSSGSSGGAGSDGRAGRDGEIQYVDGDVDAAFAGIPAVTPLGRGGSDDGPTEDGPAGDGER